ncbi:MAG: hypothetical protein HXY46_06410, partial [Syntrophaceae bacterium]|nr:hypothetical protein [Syntrophaceae bacterium]
MMTVASSGVTVDFVFIPVGGKEGVMRAKAWQRLLVYFVCVSFLVMMNGFPMASVEARENLLPIGEMVSKGEVKFEARENVWRKVESS